MEIPFDDNFNKIADSMGIALHQRFDLNEASLFLHCTSDKLLEIQSQNQINCIHLPDNEIEFFGHQLLDYLLNSVSQHPVSNSNSQQDRIVRSKEVEEMTGLSRTTLWRLERKGDFPNRVPLGEASVGWKLSEINTWINSR